MKRKASKIKIYSHAIDMAGSAPWKEHTLDILLWSFGFMALAYVLILGSVVWNIVERKTLEAEARSLGSELSALELKYLSLSGEMGPELGRSMGFIETKNQYFATRKSLGSLSLLGNEL